MHLKKLNIGLLLLYISLNSIFCYSQEKKIYIFYNRNSPVEILNNEKMDSSLEIFKFNLNKGSFTNELSIDNNGVLVKKVRLKNNDNHYLNLRYEHNSKNVPLLVKQSELKNTLYPRELTAVEYENLISILKQYDDIYIINEEKCDSGYCIARKVVVLPALEKL